MGTLFVMCPQNSFLDPTGSVYMGEKAEILKTRLQDYLPHSTDKKIFFREKHAESDEFFSSDKTHSIVNTPEFQIESSLQKYIDMLIDTTRYSGFYDTGLDSLLKREKISAVTVIGLETHTTVLFTVEELRNRGLKVSLIEPLLASRDDFLHNTAISLMINNLGVSLNA
jgi:nicotinamidase/pyrazinamidase